MNNSIKSDDIIFNFFKQICDEKDDEKCVELGNSWIKAMENNLKNMFYPLFSLSELPDRFLGFNLCLLGHPFIDLI